MYLARAPKSNASYVALGRATQDVRERGHLRPPASLRSAAHPGERKLGRGQGYLYPHDDPRGFDVDCLPDELAGHVYFEPSGIGEEVPLERSAQAPAKVEVEPDP